MKNIILIGATVGILIGGSFSSYAANAKKIEPSNKPANKEEMDVVKNRPVSKEASGELAKIDTVYVNGEAAMLSYSLSPGKDKRLFSVHNMRNEMIAYIIKMNYLNGKTYYQVNYPQTKQSTFGAIYESPEALIEIISGYVVDGKITSDKVNEIAASNKFVIKNNVEFQVPQGNLDDIQRAFYDELNRGKALTEAFKKQSKETITTSAPVGAIATPAPAQVIEKPVTPVETQVNNTNTVTLKNFSTSNQVVIINRKINNQVATDKTSINAGATNTFNLSANDEIVLSDAKGKKIAAFVVKPTTHNIIISADGKRLANGKANASSDVAMAR